ncbi:MAG: hypothetical protein HOV67_21935 [Kribbellaceae bacterium]|nr:hypothetical protein [Kribbellaceae bacterium]
MQMATGHVGGLWLVAVGYFVALAATTLTAVPAPSKSGEPRDRDAATNLGRQLLLEIRWSCCRSAAYLGSHALRDC